MKLDTKFICFTVPIRDEDLTNDAEWKRFDMKLVAVSISRSRSTRSLKKMKMVSENNSLPEILIIQFLDSSSTNIAFFIQNKIAKYLYLFFLAYCTDLFSPDALRHFNRAQLNIKFISLNRLRSPKIHRKGRLKTWEKLFANEVNEIFHFLWPRNLRGGFEMSGEYLWRWNFFAMNQFAVKCIFSAQKWIYHVSRSLNGNKRWDVGDMWDNMMIKVKVTTHDNAYWRTKKLYQPVGRSHWVCRRVGSFSLV